MVRSWTVTFFTLYFTYQSTRIQSLCLISLLCWWHCPLYCSLSKDSVGLDRLTNCSVHQKHWFLAHDLLNPTKSESSYFGTRQRLDFFNLPTDIDIADSHIPVHDHLKTLGVTMDKHFTFAPHAQSVVIEFMFITIIFRHYLIEQLTVTNWDCRSWWIIIVVDVDSYKDDRLFNCPGLIRNFELCSLETSTNRLFRPAVPGDNCPYN